MKLVRVLVYEGPEDWLTKCIANRSVKEHHKVPLKGGKPGIVTEAMIGLTGGLFENMLAGLLEKSLSDLEGQVVRSIFSGEEEKEGG